MNKEIMTTKTTDWWNTISEPEKQGIKRGLRDIQEGRTISHDLIKEKYNLDLDINAKPPRKSTN